MLTLLKYRRVRAMDWNIPRLDNDPHEYSFYFSATGIRSKDEAIVIHNAVLNYRHDIQVNEDIHRFIHSMDKLYGKGAATRETAK